MRFSRSRNDSAETERPATPQRPNDATADLVRILQRTSQPYPPMMPRPYEAGARWFQDLLKPYHPDTDAPRRVQCNPEGWRWEYPYHQRAIGCLHVFLRMSPDDQVLVVDVADEGLKWSGEQAEHFMLVLREWKRRQDIGSEAYRQEAIAKLKSWGTRVVSDEDKTAQVPARTLGTDEHGEGSRCPENPPEDAREDLRVELQEHFGATGGGPRGS
jgi:hypothetical protein